MPRRSGTFEDRGYVPHRAQPQYLMKPMAEGLRDRVKLRIEDDLQTVMTLGQSPLDTEPRAVATGC